MVSIHLDIGLHGLDLLHGLYLDIHLLMGLLCNSSSLFAHIQHYHTSHTSLDRHILLGEGGIHPSRRSMQKQIWLTGRFLLPCTVM
jgi:hypothetical protein